ncbi:MAG: sugar ABC transporter substrate-binding protein [Spirochaetaceae bacterium]|jgi:multiple sugar transport system substrate-binding protein|nr:sugar ABC transporter substrate-binding protein [Spirochaetaceae bacterium]
MDIKKLDWFLFCLAIGVLGTGFFLTLIFSPNHANDSGNITLVFAQWWQDELEKDTLEAIIREYEALHPGVTLRLVHRPYDVLAEELLNPAEKAPPPDILGLDSHWLYELIRMDMLEPLESYTRGEPALDQANLFPEEPPGEHKKWALPLISFMAPLFYNSALLEAAGFDRPPKTRGDFLAYAKALTDPPAGIYGMTLALGPENPQGLYRDIFSWIWASGVEFVPERALDFTDPAVVETLDFLNRLYQEGVLSPASFTKTEEEKRREFMEGRAAMMVGSIPEIHRIMEGQPTLRFGISTIPSVDTYPDRPVFGLTSWYAGISRESLHKEEAWAFLSFLAERRSFLAAMAHAVPGSGDEPGETAGENFLYTKAYDMYTAGAAADRFAGIPKIKELETILREELTAMFEGKRPPPETARAIQQRRDALGTVQE